MYDFCTGQFSVIDLDLYAPEPFELQRDRNYGSRRLMAPEEFVRGARIDQITNVFTLGRIAFQFLSDGSTTESSWRLNSAAYGVALKAVEPEREHRYASVAEFVTTWQASLPAEREKTSSPLSSEC
jgi:serine/threonine-protein kinase